MNAIVTQHLAGIVALPAILLGASLRLDAQLPWIEGKTEHFSVFYQAGFEQDELFARTWANRAELLMKDKYGVVPRHYRLSIYLYPAPAPGIDVNNARIRCCTSSAAGDSTGTIEMLAPSAPAMKTSGAISSLGMRKNDESYHAKILMSEYIPVGHYEAQNNRAAGGWSYYTAPNWFVQGLQEYDAIFHTTDTNRDVTARRLTEWAAARPGTFSCCNPGLVISDDYNGGAAFVTFLAAQFGEGIHSKLLRSPLPTFASALSEETKPYSRDELLAKFRSWLQSGAPMRPGGR
jgi:hypothetical protein